MILEFKIENFLSFKEKQTFSFEATSDKHLEDYYCVEVKPGVRILKMGIIYGANASGKTNLLKAFNVLRTLVTRPKNDKYESTGFNTFKFDKNYDKKPGSFELIFFIRAVKYIYTVKLDEFKIQEEKLTYYPSTQPAEIFSRITHIDSDLVEITFGSKIKIKPYDKAILEGNTLSNMTALSAFNKTNIDIPELKKVFFWFKNDFERIITPKSTLGLNYNSYSYREQAEKNKEFKLELLNKADFNISDFKVEDNPEERTEDENEIRRRFNLERASKNKLSFTHQIQNETIVEEFEMEAKDQSSGTLRYFGLGNILHKLTENNTFVSIDELESSLHPDLVQHFLLTFLANSNKSQILVSTHNLNILEEADNARKDIFWFAEKNEAGATKIYPLSDFDIRKNLSFANAYKAGKFGAKPKLGNPFIEQTNAATK